MKALGLNRTRLIRWSIASGAVFTALLLFLWYQGDRFILQNSLFLTGFILVMITLFRVALWSGLFNLLTYGYSQILASLKSANKADEEERVSFFEYNRTLQRTIHWEPGLLGAGYWVVSLVLRLFS